MDNFSLMLLKSSITSMRLIRDSYNSRSETAQVFIKTLMVIFIWGNGGKILTMVREFSYTQTDKDTKVNLLMASVKDKEHSITQMEECIKVTGKTISKMVSEFRMVLTNMKEIGGKE